MENHKRYVKEKYIYFLIFITLRLKKKLVGMISIYFVRIKNMIDKLMYGL